MGVGWVGGGVGWGGGRGRGGRELEPRINAHSTGPRALEGKNR